VDHDELKVPETSGSILKLDPNGVDDAIELEFELRFLKSLTTAQRFELMLQKSKEMADLLRSCGHGSATSIVKRA
jgi:hypothetical protein